ncbi:hypothetical protein INH39_24605 [Massilia violaceinigra]|uniref:Uncharacterized protein n=1 Tax=Massilia violaceinigra TaxID=2045208 RepID=A0ABY4A4V7_9BURK|nr:hypothetical protein [Massilia violaceinigra]UOD28601.1 hypothetical protein INH39_24605 [Massilia violaceinigra]
MEFFIDRKTLLAINRLAAEMLREMDKRNSAAASRQASPTGTPGSRGVQMDSDLWPSATTRFSPQEIRQALLMATKKLNSVEPLNCLTKGRVPNEREEQR